MPVPDFDPFSGALMADPLPLYRDLRAQCPVQHSAAHGGFWAVSRYADVKAVAEDFRSFTSTQTNSIQAHVLPKMIPIDLDPPHHRHYRRVVAGLLTAEAVEPLEQGIRAHARDLVGALAGKNECDLVEQFTRPFPMAPIFSLIGISLDKVMNIFAASEAAVFLRVSDPEKAKQGASDMLVFATEVAIAARTDAAEGTLLHALVSAEVKGVPLTNDEIARYLLILLFGGLDTTTSTLSSALYFLRNEPELRHRLGSDAEFARASTDEFVRLSSTATTLTRRCTRDLHLAGVEMAQGDKVAMIFASANRDADVFVDPDKFDETRDPRLHLGFGAGAHTCLGQHLARLLIGIGLNEFLKVIPDYAIEADFVPTWNLSEVRGLARLPITF